MKSLRFLLLALVFMACAPKVSTKIAHGLTPLNTQEEVRVLGLQDPAPQNAQEVGLVKIGDTGFSTNCGWEVVVAKAQAEARKAGGNVIKIVEHLTPNIMSSSCHRITARILRVNDFNDLNLAAVGAAEPPQDSAMANADYALLHVYRFSGMGPLINYDLYLGDSVICRVKNNWKETIKIKKDGLNTIWARTEKKTEVPIDIKMGQEYYIRCAVSMGAFVGHPQISVVDKYSGILEIQSIKEKKKK